MLVLQPMPKINPITKKRWMSRGDVVKCNNISLSWDQAESITRVVTDTSKYFCLGVGIYSALQWNMYRNIRKDIEKKEKDKK